MRCTKMIPLEEKEMPKCLQWGHGKSLQSFQDMTLTIQNALLLICGLAKWRQPGSYTRWSDRATILYASMRLCGTAKTWYHAAKSRLTTWAIFSREFKINFPTRVDIPKVHEQLKKRKKSPKETIVTYYHEMVALGAKINLDDASLRQYIIGGIPSASRRTALRNRQYNSLPELLVALQDTEVTLMYLNYGILGHVSGAHINPAVTLAFLICGQMTILRAILYVIVQCLGAVAGTAGLKVFLPETEHGGLCHLYLHPDITVTHGVFIELLLTFLLVLCILGVSDENKSDSKFSAALTIGLIVVLGNLSAINFTGASMNPARYFGSAVIAGSWENHWVYWVGPLLGAIVATAVYWGVFRAPPPLHKGR
uniref:Putative aquaporin major intrinsic protein family n=1 Tax=Lutzomyia longipalpis TaxID=7200 RepID=A0A1B0CW62_LUTLO